MNWDIPVQLITALLGSLGFGMLFGIKSRYYPFAAFGGLLSWGMYILMMCFTEHIFISCFLASAFSALYSEIVARVKKAPATLFFISAVIPLIPGSSLYYTCSHAVSRQWELVRAFGYQTMQWALAIAAGGCVVWAALIMTERIKSAKQAK